MRRQTLNENDSEYLVEDSLLYRKSKLYISDKNELREILVQKIYEHSMIDYSEIQRTRILVQRNYYRKSKLYISDKNELREILVQKIYEHSMIDYSEIQRTRILVQRNYY